MKPVGALPAVALSLAVLANVATGDDRAALEQGAQQVAAQFVARLQPQLKDALQSGGPANAIEVCSVQAPLIAGELSGETGWHITRVSLKPRNTQRAQADTWEREVLQAFDRRAAAGAAPESLRTSAVVEGRYRYMQAQPVQPVCLICHGEKLSAEVSTALGKYYPDDIATGYRAGQVRGAISVSRPWLGE